MSPRCYSKLARTQRRWREAGGEVADYLALFLCMQKVRRMVLMDAELL